MPAGASMTERIDSELCERLVARAIGGDDAALDELAAYLWHHSVELAQRRLRGVPQAEDMARTVALQLAEKLARSDRHHLHLYTKWRFRHREKAFVDWYRIVVANAARDARRAAGMAASGELPSSKRLLNELATHVALEDVGVRPPYTDAQTARELLAFAEEHLSRERFSLLSGWLEGASFEELGRLVELDAEAARAEVRAAVAVLRRRFAGARTA
jgi:hypothetical protein